MAPLQTLPEKPRVPHEQARMRPAVSKACGTMDHVAALHPSNLTARCPVAQCFGLAPRRQGSTPKSRLSLCFLEDPKAVMVT